MKQHLANLRRKDMLPRLRNDLSVCRHGRLFCLELCGFCYDTRLGRESSWPQVPQDPSFFRPLRVKGAFCALTGRAAFLFRGNVEKAVCIAYTSEFCIV